MIIATRIEKKSLPNSDFELPSDYKLMEGFSGMASSAGPGSPAGADFTKKMMNASPEERQKMIEDMRKKYGAQGNQ